MFTVCLDVTDAHRGQCHWRLHEIRILPQLGSFRMRVHSRYRSQFDSIRQRSRVARHLPSSARGTSPWSHVPGVQQLRPAKSLRGYPISKSELSCMATPSDEGTGSRIRWCLRATRSKVLVRAQPGNTRSSSRRSYHELSCL